MIEGDKMGTKVYTLPEKAGVKCPKETGDLDKELSCRVCEYYHKCMAVLSRTLWK